MKKNRKMKMMGMLVTGAMLFQFGGCLGGLWQQIGIGFGRGLGALPVDTVNDLFIAPLLEGITGGDGA